MTISAHNRWAWGGDEDGVKPLADCLLMLIRAAGGDGNVLMNVGPRPDGLIDPEQANRLKDVGAWLAKYGESIYGTRGGPFKPAAWGVSTRKNKQVFVHVLKWPAEGVLRLPSIPVKIKTARVLTGGTVEFKQNNKGISLSVPPADYCEIDTLIVLELKGSAMELAPVEL